MNFCSSCGMTVVAGARFCGECGHELIQRPTQVETPPAGAAQIWSSQPTVVVDPETDDDEELFTRTIRRSDLQAMQDVAAAAPAPADVAAPQPVRSPFDSPRYEPAAVLDPVPAPEMVAAPTLAPLPSPAPVPALAASPDTSLAPARPASSGALPTELLAVIGLMVLAAGFCFYIGLKPLSSTADLFTSGTSYGFRIGLFLLSIIGLFCLFGASLLYVARGLSRADRVARGLAYVLLGSVAATLGLNKVHATSTNWVIAVSLGALAILALSPSVASFFKNGPSSVLPTSIAIAVTLLKAWAAVVGILGFCLLPIGSSVGKLEVAGWVMIALAAGAVISAQAVLARNSGGRNLATFGAVVSLVLLGVVGRDFESVIVPMTVGIGIIAFLWLPAESTVWFAGGSGTAPRPHQWNAVVPEPLSPGPVGTAPGPPQSMPIVVTPAPNPPGAGTTQGAAAWHGMRGGELPAGGYTLLTLRTGEEDDGRFYPVLGDNPLIEREPSDGARQDQLTAVNLTAKVVGGSKNIAAARKIKADVLITEARVAVACEKYDKGGGWVGFGLGGIAVSLTANAVSKSRARRRSRGKVLVGQVRFSWLIWSGYTSHPLMRAQTLRLVLVVPGDRGPTSLLLDIGLPMSVDVAGLSLSIAQQAARYQLQHNAGPESGRSSLVALVEAPTAEARNSDGFTGYSLAWALPVSGETAYPQ